MMYIAYFTSDAYAPYAGISLTSLFENNKNEPYIKAFICVYDISGSNKRKFTDLAEQYNREIEFLYINDFLDELDSKYHISNFNGSTVGYSRMFPGRIFPEYVDRLLYIDSDTVIAGSLNELFFSDMSGKGLCMAENLNFELHPETLPENERSATVSSGKNFNTGVILFDIEQYKKLNIEKLIENELLKQDRYSFGEQSISNICIPHEYIGHLPLKYNYSFHTKPKLEEEDLIRIYSAVYNTNELRDAVNNPVVIHYLGFICRAWFKESKSSLLNEYKHYKNKSQWKDIRETSIYKTPAYSSMSIMRKLRFRIIILLWNSRILHFYKKTFGKITVW